MQALADIKSVLNDIGVEREHQHQHNEDLKNMLKQAVKDAFEETALEI